jgi:U2 small nuclear ribonucleoprotein B''
MLTLLFKQFSGFKNAQMLQNDRGRGRVEFESISHAIVALNGLQGFRLNATHSLSLSFLS